MTDQNKHFLLIAGIIVVAVVSRMLPHPANFTPLAAIALFGGAYFKDRKWAFFVPILALLFSDFLLEVLYRTGYRAYPGFHASMIFVYGSMGLVVAMGGLIARRINVFTVLAGATAASLVFFLVTNFGAWLSLPEYAKTIPGLVQAYIAGIPFYKWTLLGDLCYTALIFGVFESILAANPSLRLAHAE